MTGETYLPLDENWCEVTSFQEALEEHPLCAYAETHNFTHMYTQSNRKKYTGCRPKYGININTNKNVYLLSCRYRVGL